MNQLLTHLLHVLHSQQVVQRAIDDALEANVNFEARWSPGGVLLAGTRHYLGGDMAKLIPRARTRTGVPGATRRVVQLCTTLTLQRCTCTACTTISQVLSFRPCAATS